MDDLDLYQRYHVSVIDREDKNTEFKLIICGKQNSEEDTRLLGIAKRGHFDRFAEKTSLGYDLRLDD